MVKLGSIVTTSKNANYVDMLFDAAYWMKYCHNLDVVLLNFDFAPTDTEVKLDFEYAYCAVRIKNNQMQLITNKQKIKHLYKSYAKCPTTDYFIRGNSK